MPGAVLRALRPVNQRHMYLEDFLRGLGLRLSLECSLASLIEPVRGLGHEKTLFPELLWVLCRRCRALQRLLVLPVARLSGDLGLILRLRHGLLALFVDALESLVN